MSSYRGLSFINTRKFSLNAGTVPRDLLRRRMRVDQSRDSMFFLSWYQLWTASMPAYEDNLPECQAFLQKLVYREIAASLDPYDNLLSQPLKKCITNAWDALPGPPLPMKD